MNHVSFKNFVFLLAVLLTGCNTSNEKEINKANFTPKKEFPELKPNCFNVAFLIMNGVYNSELTAPYDVFHHTIFKDCIKPMNVFTVANTDGIITSFEGLKIIPDFNYLRDSLPRIDILVVPSAVHHLDTDLEDKKMIDFVKEVDKEAQFVTSHCDGAFVLAKAGLLNQAVSTTFPGDIENMKEMFPNLDIRSGKFFVHDGKYITSAGGAKSFEASLYLCELLCGKKVAKEIAKGLVLDWDLNNIPHLIIEKH